MTQYYIAIDSTEPVAVTMDDINLMHQLLPALAKPHNLVLVDAGVSDEMRWDERSRMPTTHRTIRWLLKPADKIDEEKDFYLDPYEIVENAE